MFFGTDTVTVTHCMFVYLSLLLKVLFSCWITLCSKVMYNSKIVRAALLSQNCSVDSFFPLQLSVCPLLCLFLPLCLSSVLWSLNPKKTYIVKTVLCHHPWFVILCWWVHLPCSFQFCSEHSFLSLSQLWSERGVICHAWVMFNGLHSFPQQELQYAQRFAPPPTRDGHTPERDHYKATISPGKFSGMYGPAVWPPGLLKRDPQV